MPRWRRKTASCPIVEPEVLMDGDHDIDALRRRHRLGAEGSLPGAVSIAGVALEGIILKPNMIVPGKKCAKQNSVAGSRASAPSRC